MKKQLVGLTLFALVATASMAQGQGTTSSASTAQSDAWFRQWELGIFGQYTKIDDKLKMDAAPAIGGSLSTLAYKWIGAQADIQYGPSKETRPPEADIKYSPYRFLMTINFPTSEKTRLILGGGYVNSIYKGRSSPNEYEDGVSALLGLKLCGSGKWGGRLDGLADMNPSPNEQEITGTSVNYGVRLGVTYALKGDCLGTSKFDWQMAIAPTTAVVALGSTRQFALSGSDDKARAIALGKILGVACTSSDPSVVTVDNTANVRALKGGNATITCTGAVKNLGRSVSATVSVPDWTLAVTPATETRNVGQTASFTAAARDGSGADLGASNWTSSAPGVATVNNGTVTCVSAGTATITASKEAMGTTKTATATMTCLAPPPVPVAVVRIDSTHFDFNRATVKPAGQALLQTVIDAMKRDASIRISVEGHTDWYGDDAYNMRLSTSRANAVMTTLRRLAGRDIAADRFSAKGYGEQCILVRDGDPDPNPPRPRVSEANKAAQAPNRRVAIWQLLPEESGSPASCRLESQATNRIPFSQMR